MPRIERHDEPGAFHHVMNRGVDHGEIFKADEDYETLLHQLEDVRRRRLIEVLAYTLMTNHYHLLVRSLDGRLSDAMQILGYNHAAQFNERIGRDGPLFRGRFHSVRIKDERHLLTVVRYIDLNPVRAGMVSGAEHHEHGSAKHYLRQAGPAWLERGIVEGLLKDIAGATRYEVALYRELLDDAEDRTDFERVERSFDRRRYVPIGLGEFLTRVENARAKRRSWRSRAGGRHEEDCWLVAIAGVLKSEFSMSLREIAHHCGGSRTRIARLLRVHSVLCTLDSDYRKMIDRLIDAGSPIAKRDDLAG